MPDHGTPSERTTLAALADKINQLNARVDARDAENARLEARLRQVEAWGRSGNGPAGGDGSDGRDAGGVGGGVPSAAVAATHEHSGDAQPVSRRGAFKVLGAAAAGGVGVALGSAILSAEPAAATTGTMMFGADNDAGSDATTLTAATPDAFVTFLAKNTSPNGFGLYGVVEAESGIPATEGSAVVGDTSGKGPGIEGLCGTGGVGVHGVSGGTLTTINLPSIGVFGENNSSEVEAVGVAGGTLNGAGVVGYTTGSGDGVGVVGSSQLGTGATFFGGHAPLRLGTGGGTGPPTDTGHNPGEFSVDMNGALFYCYDTDEWVALTNGTFPIPPVRVIDTADGTGGITGPLVPGSTVHTSSAIAGTHGIPAAAVGVVGNLAISGVNGALLNGVGFATLFPAGEATPATANINAGAGCFAISNAVTVGLGTGGSNAASSPWSGPVGVRSPTPRLTST